MVSKFPCFWSCRRWKYPCKCYGKDKTNAKEMEDGHKAIEEIFNM